MVVGVQVMVLMTRATSAGMSGLVEVEVASMIQTPSGRPTSHSHLRTGVSFVESMKV